MTLQLERLDSLISPATRQNWHKLGILQNQNLDARLSNLANPKNPQNHTQITKPKLTTRANKKLSCKNIIPTEYFCNAKNIALIERIVRFIVQKNYSTKNAIYSLALNLLKAKNLLHKAHIQAVLDTYKDFALDCAQDFQGGFECYDDLLDFSLPCDEVDLLGLIYQCLLLEGEKNIAGAYYTPHAITREMTKGLDFGNGEIFLDPACGSGAFILSLENAMPNQIFGIDNNPLAVFIAKINMLIKFSDIDFIPQIYCADFLDFEENLCSDKGVSECLNKSFDYICTNPPWGIYRAKNYRAKIYESEIYQKNQNGKKAQSKNTNPTQSIITSGERFSLFFVKSYAKLKPNGVMNFLLPNAMLNVKAHKDLREFILHNGTLEQIKHYANIFSGVSTEFVSITHKKYLESRADKTTQSSPKSQKCKIIKNNDEFVTPISAFLQSQNHNFSALSGKDLEIIKKAKSIGKYDLNQSIWALGIVTGDNKNTLHKERIQGSEEIYTGKEIAPYHLKQARNFILYDRAKFQQVAKDEYYRASEKLVYKFISSKLVFAYDESGALFLNSANILIPKIPNMSIKTALGFLNSELFAYLHIVLFGEIKVLKGNLAQLPFPKITSKQDSEICALVSKIISADSAIEAILQDKIYEIYQISSDEQIHIKKVLSGKAKR